MNIYKNSLKLLLKELKKDSNIISKLASEKHLENVVGGVSKFNKFSAGTMAALNILASTNAVGASFNSSDSTNSMGISKNINISSIVKKLTVPVLVAGGVLLVSGVTYLLISKLRNCKSVDEFKKIQDEAHNLLTNRESVVAYLNESKKALLKQTKNSKLRKSITDSFNSLEFEVNSCDFKEQKKDVEVFSNKIKGLSNKFIEKIKKSVVNSRKKSESIKSETPHKEPVAEFTHKGDINEAPVHVEGAPAPAPASEALVNDEGNESLDVNEGAEGPDESLDVNEGAYEGPDESSDVNDEGVCEGPDESSEEEIYEGMDKDFDDLKAWENSLEGYLCDIATSALNHKQANVQSYCIRNDLDVSCTNDFVAALNIACEELSDNFDPVRLLRAIRNRLNERISIQNRNKILTFLQDGNLDSLKKYLNSKHSLTGQVRDEDRRFGDIKITSAARGPIYNRESFRRLFNESLPANKKALSVNCIGLGPNSMTLRERCVVNTGNLDSLFKLMGVATKEAALQWGRNTCKKWLNGLRTTEFDGDSNDLHGTQSGPSIENFLFNHRAGSLRSEELANLLFVLYVLDRICTQAGFEDCNDFNIDAELSNIPDSEFNSWSYGRRNKYIQSRNAMASWTEKQKSAFNLWCGVVRGFGAIEGEKCKNQIVMALNSGISKLVKKAYVSSTNDDSSNITKSTNTLDDSDINIAESYFSKMFTSMKDKVYNATLSKEARHAIGYAAEYGKSLHSFLEQLVNIPSVSSQVEYLNGAVDLNKIDNYNDIIDIYRDNFTVDVLLDSVDKDDLSDMSYKLKYDWSKSSINFKLLDILTRNRLSKELKCISDCFASYLSSKNYKLSSNDEIPSLDYNPDEYEEEDEFFEIMDDDSNRFIYAYKHYIDSLLDGSIVDVSIQKLYPIYHSIYRSFETFDIPISDDCVKNVCENAFETKQTNIDSYFSYIFFRDDSFKTFKEIFGKQECINIQYIFKLINDGHLIFDKSAIQ